MHHPLRISLGFCLMLMLMLMLSAPCVGQTVQWQRIQLDDAFRSEGVTVADVNHDGRKDILAGDMWYEQPAGPLKPGRADWKMHWIRPEKHFVAGKGYSDCFANWAWDVNGDGWTDSIYLTFPGKEFWWYENPQNKEGLWKQHVIWHSACGESPDFGDITGDGKPELIIGSQPEAQTGFVPLPSTDKATEKWTFHPVSEPGDPKKNGSFKYYHGLGYGDLNNDGRCDVLIAHGWWQAPQNPKAGPWQFHPYVLSEDGTGEPLHVADIHVYDLDLDGDNDLITSSAHRYGFWWFENVGGNAKPSFKYHLIDDSWSQPHASEIVDINGDGTKDFVTGKRYYAHNGNDPGGNDPAVMYWYEIKLRKGAKPQFVAHEIEAGRDTGVGTQFLATDFDGDGDCDIALSNKKGVNLLIQSQR